MSEIEIINLCQNGNIENFKILYEKYFDQIYKFVYLKTYNIEITQDITSETFLKAIDKIKTFKIDDNSSFKAWIYRIAYNLVIDTYKKDKQKISIDEIIEIGYDNNFGNNLDNKEKLKEIFMYFDSLNKKHKEILIMRLWDDLSYKEISEISGESLDNCKKIVSRSIQKIPNKYFSLLLFFLIF